MRSHLSGLSTARFLVNTRQQGREANPPKCPAADSKLPTWVRPRASARSRDVRLVITRPEGPERSAWVAGVAAEAGCDVGDVGQSQGAGGQVAPGGQGVREGPTAAVAGEVDFGGQSASGSAEGMIVWFVRPVDPFRPVAAACWWVLTMVGSICTSQSVAPAASARAHTDPHPDEEPENRCRTSVLTCLLRTVTDRAPPGSPGRGERPTLEPDDFLGESTVMADGRGDSQAAARQ